MDMQDRVFLALLMTLFVGVIIIERYGRAGRQGIIVPQVIPPGKVNQFPNWLDNGNGPIRDSNLPICRGRSVVIYDAAYVSADEAAGENG